MARLLDPASPIICTDAPHRTVGSGQWCPTELVEGVVVREVYDSSSQTGTSYLRDGDGGISPQSPFLGQE